jgi:hypothetical protein
MGSFEARSTRARSRAGPRVHRINPSARAEDRPGQPGSTRGLALSPSTLHLRRSLGPLLALTAVLFSGTVGYMLIEGWTWDDALYMVITTVSTVGFGEVHPLSRPGRWVHHRAYLAGRRLAFLCL